MHRTKIGRTQASNAYLACACTVLKSGEPKHQTRIWLPCSCTVLKSGEPKHQTRIWLPCSRAVLKSGEAEATACTNMADKYVFGCGAYAWCIMCKHGGQFLYLRDLVVFRHGQPCTNMAVKNDFGCHVRHGQTVQDMAVLAFSNFSRALPCSAWSDRARHGGLGFSKL